MIERDRWYLAYLAVPGQRHLLVSDVFASFDAEAAFATARERWADVGKVLRVMEVIPQDRLPRDVTP